MEYALINFVNSALHIHIESGDRKYNSLMPLVSQYSRVFSKGILVNRVRNNNRVEQIVTIMMKYRIHYFNEVIWNGSH